MIKKKVTRIIAMSFALMLCIPVSGCADKAEEPVQEEKQVVVESPSPSVAEIPDEKPATAAVEEASQEAGTEDEYMDLTEMSSTAVYGAVYNMMYYPEKFVGKTIKMEGAYSDYFDIASGNHYFACIIMDATACCAQGIEFSLNDDYKYPDDYPSEGDNIIVEGVFDTYIEESGMYCILRDATLSDDSSFTPDQTQPAP
jgi:hypothetical protein